MSRLKASNGFRSIAVAAAAVASLVGCGGVDYLTVSGVAAEGPALAGATVTATCAGGSQTAPVTTNANGTYSVYVQDGAAPCIVTTTKGNVTYQAVTAGSGSTLTVNPSPVSTIIVELLKKEFVGTGASVSALVNNAAAKAALSGSASSFAAAVSSAIATAAAANNPVAQAIANQFNEAQLQTLLTGSFTAASGSTAGDSTDVKLDAVVTALQTQNIVSSSGVVDISAVQNAVQSIDVALPGTSGATGGSGASGAGNG